MKRVIVISLLLFYGFAVSQTDNTIINFEAINLEIPNAPAFVLLDAAPSTIQRPNSSRALGISILQDIATDGILDNIAVEITPFWLKGSVTRSALSYYGIDQNKKQYPFSKLKLASFSVAYVKAPDSIVNISLGARATVFELKRRNDIEDYLDTYGKIEDLNIEILDLQDLYQQEHPEPDCENDGTDPRCSRKWELYNNEMAKYLRNAIVEISEKQGYTQQMQDIINRKPALAVDLAMAYNHRFEQDQFNNNGFGRLGVWSTVSASFFLNRENFDYFILYGFVRYLREEQPITFSTTSDYNAFDMGVKGELEFNKLTVGYEYINRSGDLSSYRSAGNIKYQVLENVYLTGSFGNNFEKQDDLIALFGIQWGLNGANQLLGIGN